MLRTVLFSVGMALAMTLYASAEDRLYPEVDHYIQERLGEVDQIPAERRQRLLELARHISVQRAAGKSVKLLFVCTHNSRRSHLSQIWAQVGASHFGLNDVTTYSGGTEATAMNSRTVAVLKRAGLRISTDDKSSNPKYVVAFTENTDPLICFSKTLADPPNPIEQFAAIMTCANADVACPTIQGADLRLAITYDDPKASDGTAEEAATYDERSRQIAREMLFVMSQAARR